ncbi:alpha-L-rhamnosidase N-terminal domain-containing protein [Streptomyces sp. NPDC005262]|uniref:alpha-L-rhamnosidase N-terminal domain-containing protein n=1 Tax=Streptomyces sp. NPDC005262 TaxID=3364710 RepID=UPI0036A0BFB0
MRRFAPAASAEVVAGFLPLDAWHARFIGSGSEAPHLIRGTFDVHGTVRRALLHSTAFGAYDIRINDVPADDSELKPGWTSCQWRVNLDVADVTAHIRPGRNALGITLTGGWYTERFGFRDAACRVYEGAPAAAAQLTLDYEDGTVETVITHERWHWARAPVVSASLYQGRSPQPATRRPRRAC